MNEPVAWMVERTTGTKGYGDTPYVTLLDATKPTYWIENKIPEGYTVIPLYTHPVKEQELLAEIEKLKAENSHLKYEISSGAWSPVPLTDAELSEVYEEVYINYAGKDFPVDLGRAILRKAQEQ